MFFFWLLIFPLLFAFIFGLAFPESPGKSQKIALNVIDRDQSFLSKALIDEMRSKKYVVKVLKSDEEKSIRALIIPEDFSKNILAGNKTELVLEKEAGSSLEASQAAYSNVLKAIIKIIAKVITLSPQNENDLKQTYGQNKLERLITLKPELAGKLQSIPAGFNHMIPPSDVMFILFTVLMYGGINLLQERRTGQLERIYLSPASFSSIIGGKWVSRLFLGMIQIILLFLVGKILFRTYLGQSITALFLIALFFCGTIAGMSILLGSVIKKEEVLIVFTILLANIMAALGGCWMPIELFPEGLKRVSFIFPTGWAMDAFHKLIFFGQGLKSILPNIVVLLIYTLVFLIIAVKFFKLRRT